MESQYTLRGIAKFFQRGPTTVRALDGIDLEIDAGELVALEGPSGSGKTTLLQLLGALDRPSAGDIVFEGRNLSDLRDRALAELRLRSFGFVFQQFNLIPTLTAVENVEVKLAPAGGTRARALELLAELRSQAVPHGIATSGRRPEIDASLEALQVGPETTVVARGDVARAKPEPDLFLECSRRLNAAPEDCYVVGDAVWDLLAARRARMLSVGVLSGGYGEEELARAGAFQVYRDAEELRTSLDELGLVP
jgi:beta-phosphoglucomutase-like phosphatase (HAD superfamily)